jgi:hypothetical protein
MTTTTQGSGSKKILYVAIGSTAVIATKLEINTVEKSKSSQMCGEL